MLKGLLVANYSTNSPWQCSSCLLPLMIINKEVHLLIQYFILLGYGHGNHFHPFPVFFFFFKKNFRLQGAAWCCFEITSDSWLYYIVIQKYNHTIDNYENIIYELTNIQTSKSSKGELTFNKTLDQLPPCTIASSIIGNWSIYGNSCLLYSVISPIIDNWFVLILDCN